MVDFENQINVLSNALKTSSVNDRDQIAMFFAGHQYDSMPRALLEDTSITSLDKYAWQRLYIELQKYTQNNYFPTYDNLQILWGNQGGTLSRKTVREILSRLVLSGWLSFRMIRNNSGQIMGNIYILHNTALPLEKIIDESVIHILTSMLDKNVITKSLAILAYNLVNSYINKNTQSENIFLHTNNLQDEIDTNFNNIASSLLTHLQNVLSSKSKLGTKLGTKQLNSKSELSAKQLSSKNELSAKQLSSKSELSEKSSGYYDGSSTTISSTVFNSTTNNNILLNVPDNIKVYLGQQGLNDVIKAINKNGLDMKIANNVLKAISMKDITKIKNMTAYLVTNIQKAARGEYNNLPTTHQEQSKITVSDPEPENLLNHKKVINREKIEELFSPLKNMLSI